jgi:hypothetical protein
MLLLDAGAAALAVILLIVISPGLAVVGLVALVVLAACGVSFSVDRFRRGRPHPPRR